MKRQLEDILAQVKKGGNLLVTRIEESTFKKLKKAVPKAVYHSQARAATFRHKTTDPGKGPIVVMTAGTSDVPVGEEAAVTCEMLGNEVDRIYDVGAAGLHRLCGGGGWGQHGQRLRRGLPGQPHQPPLNSVTDISIT